MQSLRLPIKASLLTVRPDLVAGLTVAMVVLPQSMAYAAIAGVNPIYGIFSAIVPTIVGALFGSSHLLITGPTNATALVIFSVLAGISGDPARYLELVFALAVLSGAIKLGLGLLRLGSIVRYISNSVLTGFLAAAGILITVDQFGNLFGLKLPKNEGPFVIMAETLRNISQINGSVVVTALVGILTMLVIRKINKKVPAALLAIGIAGLLVQLTGWHEQGVRLVSDLGLPQQANIVFHIPNAPLQDWLDLLPAAGAVALFSLVEAMSITRAVSLSSGQKFNASREFIGQGLASLIGGLTQCIPSSGSPSRSAVNLNAGAKTRLAAASSGGFVWLTLVLFAPFIGYIPVPGLAAVVVVSAMGLIDRKHIILTWNIRSFSRMVMAATFIATLLIPLHYAIYLGVVLSIVIFLFESSQLHLNYLVFNEKGRALEKPLDVLYATRPQVAVISVEGSLYFGAVGDLEKAILRCQEAGVVVLILRLRQMHMLGSTGITALHWAIAASKKKGMRIILSGVTAQARSVLDAGGITPLIGEENVYASTETLFDATLQAIEKAKTIAAGPQS